MPEPEEPTLGGEQDRLAKPGGDEPHANELRMSVDGLATLDGKSTRALVERAGFTPQQRLTRRSANAQPRRPTRPDFGAASTSLRALKESLSKSRSYLKAGERCGPYEVIQEIAHGGAAAVYRARDLRSGAEVALKLMLNQQGSRGSQRLIKEAAALSHLAHPAIVRFIDFGLERELPFLVMELVRGRTFKRELGEGIPSVNRVLAVFRDLAEALCYCHDQGVIHRDLKPSNILVRDGDGSPVLIDFGLVKKAGAGGMRLPLAALTLDNNQVGTLGYMSPEQIEAEGFGAVGPRTDVWGLGATLYTALTGETPFAARSQTAQVMAILKRPAPDLKAERPDAPQWLARLCAACLNKHGDRRPSMVQVLAALRGEPGAIPGPAVTAPKPRTKKTEPAEGGEPRLVGKVWSEVAYRGPRTRASLLNRALRVAAAALWVSVAVGLGLFAFLTRSSAPARESAPRTVEESIARGDQAFERGRYKHALDHYQAAVRDADSLERRRELALRVGRSRRSFALDQARRGLIPVSRAELAIALAELEVASGSSAERAEASFLVGDCRQRLGRAPSKVAAAYRAAQFYAGTPYAYLAAARLAELEGNPDQAIRAFSRALELRKGLAEALLGRGELYRRSRRYRKASLDVRRALDAFGSPEALFLRAHIRIDTADFAGARIDIDRGLELHKGSALGLGLRARLNLETGALQEALDDARAAIELDPGCYYPYLIQGRLTHEDSKMLSLARADFMEALQRAPQVAECHYWVGRVAQENGDLNTALARYTSAIDLAEGDFRCYANRGTVYRHLERYDEALRDHDKSVELAPDNGEARFQRAKARWIKLRKTNVIYNNARWDGVLEDLNIAIKNQEDLADAYGRRGYISYKRKLYTQALDDYHKAIELGSDRDQVYIWYGYRALLLTTLGRYEQGRADAEVFLEKAPGTHENRSAVREAYKRCLEGLDKAD